ncbi:HNH endonuclease signature motif containing protein [Mycolicibacterium iranicum]|uniref:DUF222 domain-containing protein n=1 Tax=Mycolicibacterium iranicum TaxID=912594 RepID=A0ABT4HG38_MYCIR|nr:HNH endonuclease signature motif containing protein [Mycolicibacterium iranicum]MCZ0729156.1 DUF222 domain-containing protein [Mycolicibacterium iranicum]
MFDNLIPEPDQLAGLTAAQLVDAARASTRAENAACARKLAGMAELFVRRTGLPAEDRLDWWIDPEAAVTAEIAAAYSITQGLALHQTYRAVVLRDRLPKVGRLFLQGLISDLLVRAIVSRTSMIVDADLIAAVDADLEAEILGWGALSVKKTNAAIDTIVVRHDPDALRKPRDCETTRGIEFGMPSDAPGFTSVQARMFSCDAAAGERTLLAMAYSVCEADPRSLDDRRNDAFTALMSGISTLACQCGIPDCEAAANPRPLRDITVFAVTDQTTPADQTPAQTEPASRRTRATVGHSRPGYIFGSGFMPAPLFAAMLNDAKVRGVIHPGQAGPEAGRFPSRALADFVRCRDLTCRFPGCDKPATEADIDHTVPDPVGPTHASNLKCLCRFHHLLKTFWGGPNGWRDRQHPDGTVVWTAPTGHTYTTHPSSRLLFPTLCLPTATLWDGDPPEIALSEHRDMKMPRRRRTRAENRAAYIAAERRRIAAERRRRAEKRASETVRDVAAEYGNDPPPF